MDLLVGMERIDMKDCRWKYKTGFDPNFDIFQNLTKSLGEGLDMFVDFVDFYFEDLIDPRHAIICVALEVIGSSPILTPL